MERVYKDPKTAKEYSLEHLIPFEAAYPIRTSDGEVIVSLQVHFTCHCYTRSKETYDPIDINVIKVERKRNGTIDERVFCRERWAFSKRLPGIIEGFHSTLCLPGSSKALFYRPEDKPHPGSHEGWYICAKLGHRPMDKTLTLSIRSVHHRINQPDGVRGGSKRFYVLLSQFYREQKKKFDWL